MIHHKVKQGSEEWRKLRCGIPTASQFDKIITAGGKASTQIDAYVGKVHAEWLLGYPLEEVTTAMMRRGSFMEDRACAAYELMTGYKIATCGLFTDDSGKLYGASPDRLVLDSEGRVIGLAQIKVPDPGTHILYAAQDEGAASKYFVQVQGEMMVTNLPWCDVVSYCPWQGESLVRASELIINRVERDVVFMQKLRLLIGTFHEKMEEKMADLRRLNRIVEFAA